MAKNLHVIYVPGVGDHADATTLAWQRRIVKSWQRQGVSAELVAMHWSYDESWESKLDRLLLRIDTVSATGKVVGLVGASAGALACINAYAARQKEVVGVVSICGKIKRPDAIGERYIKTNPALLPAAEACERSLARLDVPARKRIQSRRALYDEVVEKADNYIDGADNRRVLPFGHALTIGWQLVFGASTFIHFLKKQ